MSKEMKILLVALDTLRADHLGCFGYSRNTSPTIDRLAKESFFFEKAISPISYTQPSILSVLTSLYPSYHAQQFSNSGLPLSLIMKTLPCVLKQNSARINTGAFVSSIVLSSRQFPINDSFDVYDEHFTGHELNRPSELLRKGSQTTDKALKWIGAHLKDDFFVFLHYMDIHGPYEPPFWYRRRYNNDAFWRKTPIRLDAIETMSIYDAGGDYYKPSIPQYQLLKKKVNDKGEMVSYENNADYYISQYDSNIRYVDRQIERIVTFLKNKGIYEDTLIVLFSDHGEAFGENGIYFFHGLTVSMEQIHVPLIIKMPGKRRCIFREPVSLLDIMPTILNFYGMKHEGVQGVNLLEETPDRVIYSQVLKQLSVINGQGQLLCGKGWLENRGTSNIFKSTFGNFQSGEMHNKETTYLHFGPEDHNANLEKLLLSANKFVDDANRAAGKNLVELSMDSIEQDEDEIIKSNLKALGYI
jgi:arylsulfatase